MFSFLSYENIKFFDIIIYCDLVSGSRRVDEPSSALQDTHSPLIVGGMGEWNGMECI